MSPIDIAIGIICALVVLLGGIAIWIVVKIDCEEQKTIQGRRKQ